MVIQYKMDAHTVWEKRNVTNVYEKPKESQYNRKADIGAVTPSVFEQRLETWSIPTRFFLGRPDC